MTGDALALPPVIFNESEQAPSERLMVAVVAVAWVPAGGDASVRAVNKNLILEKKDKLVLEI